MSKETPRSSETLTAVQSDSNETCLPQFDRVKRSVDLDSSLQVITFRYVDTGIVHSLELPSSIVGRIHPFNWSPWSKTLHLSLSCLACILSSYGASSYSPALQPIASKWHVSDLVAMTGITSFTVGYGIGPMFLAPVSEFYGRKWVFVVSGLVFVVATLLCAFTPTFSGMIVCRLIAGMGASAFSMVTGIITDLYPSKESNTPMAMYAGCCVFGIGLGPLVASFIVEYASWQQVFFSQSVAHFLMVVAMVFGLRETRANVILKQKLALLNKWQQEQENRGYYLVPSPEELLHQDHTPRKVHWIAANENHTPLKTVVFESTIGPFKLLAMDPVVLFFSFWATFSWSIMFLCLGAVTDGFQSQYKFSLSQSNAVFAATCLGAMITGCLGVYHDRLAGLLLNLPNEPEARLYAACVESILLPLGLLLFGWTCRSTIHWLVPALGVLLASMGITTVYLAVFNYLADSFGAHASTAVSAQSFMRNVICGAFPLFTRQMFARLGYGPAVSVLAGIALILTAVPWILVRMGPRLREKSSFAMGPGGNEEDGGGTECGAKEGNS